jgi:ABC-type sugar transport system permease subunit
MSAHEVTSTADRVPLKPRHRSLARYSAVMGLIFISPWLIGFVLLKLIPILVALGFSFTDFHMLHPEQTRFIGLENYLNILKDQAAGASLFGSIGNFLFVVPLQMAAALLLAVLFSSERLKGKSLLRTLFFLPCIIPAVAIFYIVGGLSAPGSGWVNQLILKPLNLPDSTLNNFFPIVLSLWSIGPSFLIMYGAIQGISKEIYEAGRVDGAGPVMRLVSLTIPMISPSIFFCLVINLTNAFGGVVLLDRGLPFNQSLSPMEFYINQQMFTYSHLGYASSLAWTLFLVEVVFIVFLFRSSKYWVYFPNESENENF